jgi:tellurite resistance protein TerC
MAHYYPFVFFTLFVLGLLALDLGVFHRRARAVSFRQAAFWSAVWVLLSLGFNVGIYLWRGREPALEFLTAYLLEKSLSADNVFVFAVIFSAAAVPAQYQYRVLFWGVLGALVMRGAFIAAGAALLSRFAWVTYFFGCFLAITGVSLLLRRRQQIHPERNPLLRWAPKIVPIIRDYEGPRLFVRRDHQLFATPLFLALLMVETTDVLLALDSIPAAFAVTQDSFIVYSSNVLAVLGLRALFFLLAGAMAKFRYLRAGLSVVLLFMGLKMLGAHLQAAHCTIARDHLPDSEFNHSGVPMGRGRRIETRSRSSAPSDLALVIRLSRLLSASNSFLGHSGVQSGAMWIESRASEGVKKMRPPSNAAPPSAVRKASGFPVSD